MFLLQLSGSRTGVNEVMQLNYGSCDTKGDNRLIHGSKSLQDEMKRFVRPSGKSYVITADTYTHSLLKS